MNMFTKVLAVFSPLVKKVSDLLKPLAKKVLDFLVPFVKKVSVIFKPLVSFLSNTKSIRTKLIMAFMVSTVLIIIQGIISYSTTSKTATNLARQSSITAMESSGKYLDLVLKTVNNVSGQIFSDPDIQSYLTKEFSSDNYIEAMSLYGRVGSRLTSIATFSPDIENIIIIPCNDNIGAKTTVKPTNVKFGELKDTDMVVKLTKSTTSSGWFGFHEDFDSLNKSTADMYSISLVRLMRGVTSMDVLGLLIIDIKPDVITNLSDSIKLSDNQQIHLISPDKRVFTNGIDTEKSNTIIDEKFYTDVVAGKEDIGSKNISYNGKKYLMTYYRVSSTGYILLGLIPESDLKEAGRSVISTTVIMIILAGLIAFGTGMVIANSMSRTINRVIDASSKAASGDLTVTFNSRRQDELGTLARSISTMIGSMRSLIEQAFGVTYKVSESALSVSSTSQIVTSVSQDISRAIQEISKGASEQAADAEQGVERISELAGKINSVSENAKSIDQLTRNTVTMTQNGLSSVKDLDVKANRTTEISRDIMLDIQELDAHSKSIGKIIKVISGIADQTNLLALNATIEAARAGEMGRGFAVVADEVKKLAEQSMNSTREIAAIIKSTQDQTAKAVEKTVATESIIKSQNEAVQNTINVFGQIMDSMRMLSTQVEQIMAKIAEMEENKTQAINSIQNISAVSQETAASSQEVTASTQEQLASIEELASRADELQKLSKDLQESISKFKLN